MRRFPEPIHICAAAFSQLPGVGPKTALRYVYSLLRHSRSDIERLANALLTLARTIKTCRLCFSYGEEEICSLCRDPKRDKNTLCVVEESRDINTLEATGAYSGRYFVLGGVLNPIEGRTPDTLRIKELITRLQEEPDVTEVILALSPTVHGEGTMLYLARQLEPLNRLVNRLARGLPVGSTLEYADETTLHDAFKGRRRMEAPKLKTPLTS